MAKIKAKAKSVARPTRAAIKGTKAYKTAAASRPRGSAQHAIAAAKAGSRGTKGSRLGSVGTGGK